VKETLYYRNTAKGIEFCYCAIQKDVHKNRDVYTLEYNEGELGTLSDCEVWIDEDFTLMEYVENELKIKYPIEYVPQQLYVLSIDLREFNKEITPVLLGQLSRSIEWNFKHSGFGFVKVNFSENDKILSTTLKLNSKLNLHQILSFDLGLMGIKPSQISVKNI
jgi:hypothetical protein